MEFKERKNVQCAAVYIYDPIPLDKVSVDSLKKAFPSVVSMTPAFVLAESSETKNRVQVGVTRMEYEDNRENDFTPSSLDRLGDAIGAMPPINLKALGVNLHIRVLPKDYATASAYTTQVFLANATGLQEKLGAPIIHTACRIMYGEPSRFFDLRFTPLEIQSDWLHIQLHYHLEMNLADTERIIAETQACLEQAVKELDRLKEIV